MKKVTQTFTKGINRRIDRSQSSPERFDVLQNARIFKRGDTLDVARIDGFEQWPTVDSESSLAVLARPAEFDTTGFQRGRLLEFVDGVITGDSGPYRPSVGFSVQLPDDRVFTEDSFDVQRRQVLRFTEQLNVGDRLPRRPRIQPVLQFVDGLDVSAVGDNLTFTAFVRLSFTEGVDVRDTPICG